MPVTAVYVAEGAERDGRLREIVPGRRRPRHLAARGRPGRAGPADRRRRAPGARGAGPGLRVRPPRRPARRGPREAGEQPLIVALDSVTDPRNLGAVVRSAAGFGAHGVLIPERRSAGMTAVGVEDVGRRGRAAPGRAGHQPDPAAEGLPGGRLHGRRPGRRRRRRRCRTSSSPTARSSWWSAPRATACRGWSPRPATSCVSIPMVTDLESLNAGVAASVTLYAIAQVRA